MRRPVPSAQVSVRRMFFQKSPVPSTSRCRCRRAGLSAGRGRVLQPSRSQATCATWPSSARARAGDVATETRSAAAAGTPEKCTRASHRSFRPTSETLNRLAEPARDCPPSAAGRHRRAAHERPCRPTTACATKAPYSRISHHARTMFTRAAGRCRQPVAPPRCAAPSAARRSPARHLARARLERLSGSLVACRAFRRRAPERGARHAARGAPPWPRAVLQRRCAVASQRRRHGRHRRHSPCTPLHSPLLPLYSHDVAPAHGARAETALLVGSSGRAARSLPPWADMPTIEQHGLSDVARGRYGHVSPACCTASPLAATCAPVQGGCRGTIRFLPAWSRYAPAGAPDP